MTIMAMPKAAVNQNRCSVFRQHDIRRTGQALSVQPKPEATRVEGLADHDFRLCVLAANPRHHSGTGLSVYNVDHLTNAFWNLERYLVSYSLT
jgi:hypothetical protein